jgi:hypothetical protein
MDGWLNGKTERRLVSDDVSLKRFLVSNYYERMIAQETNMQSVPAYFKVLSLHSPEEAEENHDDLYQDSWCPGRDSNRAQTCAPPVTTLFRDQDTQHNTQQERTQTTNSNTYAHRKDLYI